MTARDFLYSEAYSSLKSNLLKSDGNVGGDVLAKAKTGTGKTLAFLLPVVEAVAKMPRNERGGFSALFISPTRELAQQITDEAKQVLVRRGICN